jgi:VanZ family protein
LPPCRIVAEIPIFPVLKRLIAYLPALVWAMVLLFVGGRSDLPPVQSPLPLDKFAHFGLYGLLGGLSAAGWRRAGRKPSLVLVLVLAAAVGIADELHQRSVANRSPEVADWVADSLGIGCFAWLVLRYTKEKTNVV